MRGKLCENQQGHIIHRKSIKSKKIQRKQKTKLHHCGLELLQLLDLLKLPLQLFVLLATVLDLLILLLQQLVALLQELLRLLLLELELLEPALQLEQLVFKGILPR